MIVSDMVLTGYNKTPLFRLFESVPGFLRRDFTEHRHTAFELSCILSGSGIYRIHGKETPIRTGDVFFFGTNEEHCITEVFPEQEMHLLNLHFEPRFIWSVEEKLEGGKSLSFFLEKNNGIPNRLDCEEKIAREITSVMLSIQWESFQKKTAYALRMKLLLLEILILLTRSFQTEEMTGKQIGSEAFAGIGIALDYINKNFSASLSLENIAAEAGMSRTYFCQMFKRLNGMTPWEYISIKRIEKAQELLRSTEKSVLDISFDCGFNNISHFNRVFRKITGQTPTKYRKGK